MSRSIVEGVGPIHPFNEFLRVGSIPSVWCPGCGIGTVVNIFIQTIEKLKVDVEKLCVLSGIGCTGKIIDYLKFNSAHSVNGNVLQYASELKLKNPNKKVVVFLNDVDFMMAGSDDLMNIGTKGMDVFVIYINNFIYYVLTEHRVLLKTPFMGTTIDMSNASPFNIPHLAKSCGARYMARWTPLHVRRLMYSMRDALQRDGLSFVEVISPCLIYYASDGIVGRSFDRMKIFHDNAVIKHNEPIENLDIRFQDKVIVGEFIDEREK